MHTLRKLPTKAPNAAANPISSGAGKSSIMNAAAPRAPGPCRLLGQRTRAATRRRSATRPGRSTRTACPWDPPGRRECTPRTSRAAGQSAGGCPALRTKASTRLLQRVDVVERAQLQQPALGVLRSQSISADCRIASHIRRDDRRSPPARASSPPASAATTARRGPRSPSGTSRPPRDSRASYQ